MTLKELKEDVRMQIRSYKETIRDLKSEHCGVDRVSGHYSQTGKYELRLSLEYQVEILNVFLKKLNSVRKLK
jgi:hypothetical protein